MALFPQDRRIVIVGGGYAGVHAAALLAEQLKGARGVLVTLLSERGYFLDRCRLHEAAVRGTPVRYELGPIFGQSCVEIAVGCVDRIDADRKLLHVADPSHGYDLPFDELFVATGSAPADYDIPGVREHACFLNTYEDAAHIREFLQNAPSGARVVVIGGGLTGVELAAEIAEWSGEEKRGLETALLEAAPRLLPGGAEEEAAYCTKRLAALGVAVRVDLKVRSVGKAEVALEARPPLPADLTVWCAGVRARLPDALGGGGPGGRVPTDELLACPGAANLLVGGDAAACTPLGADRPLAPKAMWAVQMGERAGRILAARALGRPELPSEPFSDKGELISLGRRDGCGLVQAGSVRRFISGFPAALVKDAALTYHLWGLTARTGIPPVAH